MAGPGPASSVVIIAASAGGVTALRRVVAALPHHLPAAVVVVQHRSTLVNSLLDQILAMQSRLPVEPVAQGQPLQDGCVYVGRPDLHVTITPDRRFEYRDGVRIKGVLSSADPLLESAARAFGSQVIAVVLTGRADDASDGVRHVAANGGVVIAQDPTTAEHEEMPRAAIRTGAVHCVLPVDAIGPAIVDLLAGQPVQSAPDTSRA